MPGTLLVGLARHYRRWGIFLFVAKIARYAGAVMYDLGRKPPWRVE
ncbi:hypothetical protein B597_011455 [Stutzerimonas stutzeri KOS6]|uniref:Uncharacterized protein n=1 Tax=Stutzerimonas stutzeri KOS6 TaxID=1218352 RepID=A0A061JSJ2_STUST|nr:hypothetical protein B597_011455 [Stutzerimonas stutzeri KOS6]